MKTLTDFENLQSKFEEAVTSSEFQLLIDLFEKNEQIYVIANGGLHYVASHMATDISRLVDGKYCHSFDSFGFITSSANDYGFDSIFERWLVNCVPKNSRALLIGLSCSGSSKNIIKAFDYAKALDWDLFFVTGRPSRYDCPSLCIDAHHYHTVEAFCLMFFYEIIHRLGFNCPEI
jgi:D-sedoheptulose 7-phosphate isomerase